MVKEPDNVDNMNVECLRPPSALLVVSVFFSFLTELVLIFCADLPASRWPGSCWVEQTGSLSAGTVYQMRDWRRRACPLARRLGRPISEFLGIWQVEDVERLLHHVISNSDLIYFYPPPPMHSVISQPFLQF